MKAIEDIIRSRPDAFTDRRIYTDPAVFAEEKEKIFKRVWLLMGHETEIPNPGDFRRIRVAGQPLILVRGDDGQARVLFNTCRHRASIVAVEAEGRCKTFKCPYHGFEYANDGRLVNVPVEQGYGAWFKKDEFGLVEVPRVDTFNGMIFGSFNPDVEPLLDYLGAAREYMQFCTHGDHAPLEVVDKYTYDIAANWKLLIDNTMDGYHVPFVHGAMFEAFGVTDEQFNVGGSLRTLGFHGAIDWPENRPLGERKANRYMAIFPNITVHYNASGDMHAIRQIEPVAVDRMQVTMWLLAPRPSERAMNERRAQAFTITWGPGGLFGADDARQLEWVQEGLAAQCDAPLLAARSLDSGDVGDYNGEQSMRGFRKGWNHYMGVVR